MSLTLFSFSRVVEQRVQSVDPPCRRILLPTSQSQTPDKAYLLDGSMVLDFGRRSSVYCL